jgi:hypothetical protein
MNPAPKKTKIPSLHIVRKPMPDGSFKQYVYAWRGGPRIDHDGDILEQQRAAIERVREAKPAPTKKRRARISADIQAALKISLKKVTDNAKARAGKKGREFKIGRDDIERLLEKQAWRCAVSGLMFDLSYDAECRFAYNPFGISIDRIDATKGYTRDNIRLVLTAVNFALNEWGHDVYLRIAKAVVGKHLSEAPSSPRL